MSKTKNIPIPFKVEKFSYINFINNDFNSETTSTGSPGVGREDITSPK